ncbi:unnamed protein product [Linum tenue]|uniref:Wound-responsive family protein n=1 Tax=Linum tenue TaxID=586396 RepID=A0AAV0M818_9ROSI|nr:unnamed protein product [Linum tenue]
MSSNSSKAWAVAASIGAVEALKDQLGFCRWNYVIRSAQQYARNNVRAISSKSPAAAMVVERLKEAEKAGRAEESLRKVMYLSCWGPN